MKLNDRKKTLTITSLWLFMACTMLVACDSKQNNETVSNDDRKILLLPHTPESLKEYEDGVKSFRAAQKKLQQADSVNQEKRVHNPSLNKDRER